MQTKTFFSSVLKATALAVLCSLLGILVFAVVVKFAAPSDGIIKTVNQFIKIIAVFIGCFFTVNGKLGIAKGAVSGAISTILLYAIFSLMSGSALFSLQTVIDCAFTIVIGAIAGVMAVNLRGKE